MGGGTQRVDIWGISGILVSGKVPTTAAGGGSNVAITNVSGNVRVVLPGVNTTNSALDVNASFTGVTAAELYAQVDDATPADTDEGAFGTLRMTSARALHVNQRGGVAVSGEVSLRGQSNFSLTNVSGQVPVTAGNLPIPVTVAAQPIAVSVNAGTMVSGQIKTTAVGAGGAAVAITNVSGQVRVTAGDLALPVSGHMRAQVETSAPADVNELAFGNLRMTSARGLHVAVQGTPLVNPGGGVNIASSALAVNIATPGTNIGVSAAALPQQDVSAHAFITNIGPLTDVCGVNRTASALNTFLTGTSAQIHVTAGDLPVPVTIAAQPVAVSIAAKLPIDVSAQGAALQVTAQGGSFAVSAQGAALTVSGAGGRQGALRGDAIYNAQVSNPVKFGKLAAVAGAVCADIVAGVASRRIRVLGGYFNSTGTATAIFLTTGASAALTPKIVVYGGFVLPANPYGYWETAVGSALSLQIEAGTIGGVITYQEVV